MRKSTVALLVAPFALLAIACSAGSNTATPGGTVTAGAGAAGGAEGQAVRDGKFENDINPGNSVTGILVFDIPKTAKLAKLELHDSPFSGGVLVVVK